MDDNPFLYGNPNEDHIGGFDPRSETIDDAAARIMPQLEQRLRHALGVIKDGDTSGDTVPVVALPDHRHFEWTVRYQCLGKSFGDITRAEGLSNKNNWVSEKVREVAELIGLTLREPDKGGRPRKQRPARNSRCIAIPHKRENPCPEQ